MAQEALLGAAGRVSLLPLDTFRKILVPVDMSTDSHYALEVALELQSRFGSEVEIVTLTEFGENEEFNRGLGAERTDDDLEDSARERLRRFVENVAPDAIDRVVCRAIEEVDLPNGIDHLATDWGATLVVLTSHDRPGVFRTLSEKIMKTLDVPVLLLKSHSGAPPR